jgi:hypothetical protein
MDLEDYGSCPIWLLNSDMKGSSFKKKQRMMTAPIDSLTSF